MDKKPLLQELTWQHIRPKVIKVNPELTSIIDNLNPDCSHTFFLARYPYGSQIRRQGKTWLPDCKGSLVALDDPAISREIRNKLSYTREGGNPLGLLLNHTAELFIEADNRIIPYQLMTAGTLFGAAEMMERMHGVASSWVPAELWNITAGGRSVFLLPKIGEIGAFNKLRRKYQLDSSPPRELKDHWQVYKAIASHPAAEIAWETEVLFFSQRWFERLDDPAFHALQSYLYANTWQNSHFQRNQFFLDLTVSAIQNRREIKACPYVAEISNHLLGMALGGVPGLQPLSDDSVAPIAALQRIFIEDYGADYAPVFIGPANFNALDEQAKTIFYSFHYQTAMKLPPKSSARSSILTDMYNIRWLLNKYLDEMAGNQKNLSNPVLQDMTQKVEFDFCHYAADAENYMTQSLTLEHHDASFLKALAQCKLKTIPKTAPFLNGCVRIMKKGVEMEGFSK